MKTEKPRVVSVRRVESIEDDASTLPMFHRPTAMATSEKREMPLVILLRPAWLDLPLHRLTWALARVAVAAVPAMLLAEAIWRFIHIGG